MLVYWHSFGQRIFNRKNVWNLLGENLLKRNCLVEIFLVSLTAFGWIFVWRAFFWKFITWKYVYYKIVGWVNNSEVVGWKIVGQKTVTWKCYMNCRSGNFLIEELFDDYFLAGIMLVSKCLIIKVYIGMFLVVRLFTEKLSSKNCCFADRSKAGSRNCCWKSCWSETDWLKFFHPVFDRIYVCWIISFFEKNVDRQILGYKTYSEKVFGWSENFWMKNWCSKICWWEICW